MSRPHTNEILMFWWFLGSHCPYHSVPKIALIGLTSAPIDFSRESILSFPDIPIICVTIDKSIQSNNVI